MTNYEIEFGMNVSKGMAVNLANEAVRVAIAEK